MGLTCSSLKLRSAEATVLAIFQRWRRPSLELQWKQVRKRR
ncbi:unnamed protein product [Brassica rapa]|uniref:Uncharacterized protein n=2 Tax=Brassica TaxID=3705 RepID=A0A3P6CDU9_BRACM|nr:unnamed protein product [Brassica napus]CAG7905799.1 unnamed protein product [Brassica rapa]VDD11194.1 unnamed protein product [Brassica rapa]